MCELAQFLDPRKSPISLKLDQKNFNGVDLNRKSYCLCKKNKVKKKNFKWARDSS